MHRVAPLLTSVCAALAGAAAAQEGGGERLRADVAALVSQVAASAGADVAFTGSRSYASFIPGHAWILSLQVDDVPAYGGAFFVLSEVDGRLMGELLEAAGPQGTRVLEGRDLERLLERVALEWRPLRAAFERWYRRPRPPPDPPRNR